MAQAGRNQSGRPVVQVSPHSCDPPATFTVSPVTKLPDGPPTQITDSAIRIRRTNGTGFVPVHGQKTLAVATGIFAGARAQLKADREAGYTLVMATASYRFYASAIAEGPYTLRATPVRTNRSTQHWLLTIEQPGADGEVITSTTP